jgi:6,7-dimethyl-8-ribityllumazine synthase
LRASVNKTGNLDGKKLRIAIIVSRFNPEITGNLLQGALEGLKECQVLDKNVSVVEVPGAFEIPQAGALVAAGRRVDGVIGLGAVIRGDTPHFDYISSETARGIMDAGLAHRIPFIFGVLTVNHHRQAIERSTGKDNKGREAALAAVEMALLFKKLKGNRDGKPA